jgi:hypothetical protein
MRRVRVLPRALGAPLTVAVAAAALLAAGTAAAATSPPGPERPAAPCGWLESDPPSPAPCDTGPGAGDDAEPVEHPVSGPGALPSAGAGSIATSGSDDPGYWTPERMAAARPMPMPAPDRAQP